MYCDVVNVSFGSKVRTLGCVAIGSAVSCILKSILLLYSAGSGVNRMPVILSVEYSQHLYC